MDRGYPVIFLLALGLSAPAAAAEGNPWLEEGRAAQEIEACVAATPEDEGNAGKDCGDKVFVQCAEADNWTTLAMNFCQGAVRDYWDGVVAEREEAVVSIENQQLTDWVEVSRLAYEKHRDATCSRFAIPMGTMYGPMLGGCLSEMARERAEILEDFLGEQPLIVPEPE